MPILSLYSGLRAHKINLSNNPSTTEAMRQAISLIGEAAFSGHPVSEERQQQFLKSFYEARDGELVSINGEATDVAILALMAVQSSG